MNSQSSAIFPPSSSSHSNIPRVAFVQASWHQEIVAQGRLGFLEKLAEHGIAAEQVDIIDVPGAFEIPLMCKKLAQSGQYSTLVAAALVVDGGIYRHEFVADAVISGLMQVQLEQEVPVLSMVLTPHHFHESKEHQQFFLTHFRQKGHEIANALVQVNNASASVALA